MLIEKVAEAAAAKRAAMPPAGCAKVDISGRDGDFVAVGHWKPEWNEHSGESWIGTMRGAFGTALAIAQRHTEARDAVQMAKMKNEPDPSLPLAHETDLLDREMRTLGQLEASLQQTVVDLTGRRAALEVVSIDKNDAASAAVSQQIRSHLAGMKDAARSEFLATVDDMTAAAILEAPAFVSGMHETQRDNLRERLLKAKHPETVKGIDDALEAARLTARAIKAATASTANRYLPLIPVTPKSAQSRPWA